MNYKRKILTMLSKNLEHYYPNLKNYFMCPTCLKKIPIAKTDSISEAHIIPKAAGGKLTTLLCRDCNSFFGSKQDKWFGELVRLSQAEKPSIMSTRIKEGYFEIDGIKVNGRWKMDSDKNFGFSIYNNLNSPEINSRLDNLFKASPSKITLSVPLPVMKNKHFIDIGFLTAGYLMWFGFLGYSWVLQGHLDPIRKQILNPDKELIRANFIATCRQLDCKPWIGFLPIKNDVVLTFGLGEHIAILPPRYNPTYYSAMGTFSVDMKLSDVTSLEFPIEPRRELPAGLMFEDKVLVFPDLIEKVIDSLPIIHFAQQSYTASTLRKISEDEAANIEKEPNVQKVSVRLSDFNKNPERNSPIY